MRHVVMKDIATFVANQVINDKQSIFYLLMKVDNSKY